MKLIKNKKRAAYDCAWCGAKKGKHVHSAACPVGERYKQVQQLGGVPFMTINRTSVRRLTGRGRAA